MANDEILYDDHQNICQLDGFDDDLLDELEREQRDEQRHEAVHDGAVTEDENKQSSTIISVINTNARSLCPKIESLIDCMEEMEGTVGIITETWLADGESLERDIQDLAKGAGLGMICRNRGPGVRGVSHGGVAIVSSLSNCTLQKVELPNPDNFEVLVTLSNVAGYSRKLLTVGCYLPPNYPVPRGRAALNYIEDVVQELKLRHLKLAGFSEPELATMYRTVIRPILDYCAVVYHPLLTDEQGQQVERIQAQALKNIYGYTDSYATMREKAGVSTHRQRRIELCDKFAAKAAANPNFEISQTSAVGSPC